MSKVEIKAAHGGYEAKVWVGGNWWSKKCSTLRGAKYWARKFEKRVKLAKKSNNDRD